MNLKERRERGLKGREWALSEEAGFTAQAMANRVGDTMEEGFKKFKPRPKFEIIKVKRSIEIQIQSENISYLYPIFREH